MSLNFFIWLIEYFLHSTGTVKGEKLSNTYNDDMDMYALSSGDSSCISSSVTGICHIEVWDYSFSIGSLGAFMCMLYIEETVCVNV